MKNIRGNITTVTQGIIVHQVNAQGVMGSGVAKAIKDKWPEVYKEYRLQYIEGRLNLGSMHLVPIHYKPPRGLKVCNLVGQEFYGTNKQHTDYYALRLGLRQLREYMDQHYMLSSDIHHPLIGCGLGGGNWYTVKQIIEEEIGPNTNLWLI